MSVALENLEFLKCPLSAMNPGSIIDGEIHPII
jgi:hypothetical protein